MENFEQHIRQALSQGLPGFPAQEAMTPPGRFPADRALLMQGHDVRRGAVMALFNPLPGGTWALVYIKRPDYDGAHGGQMAFPGGKADPGDTDILFTARRETWEEVGVTEDRYDVLGEMTPVYIPPSNFWVQPFVALAKETLHFVPDSREVEYVWQVPVEDLLADEAVSVSDFKTAYGTIKNYPCYVFGNHIIWGATAMMTAEIRALLSRAADQSPSR